MQKKLKKYLALTMRMRSLNFGHHTMLQTILIPGKHSGYYFPI